MPKVDISAIIELEDSFEELSEHEIQRSMKQGLVIAGMAIQAEARGLVPVDTSALKVSIRSDIIETNTDVIGEVGPTQRYGKEIEFGRPPGTYVSPAALAGWAKRKGLNPYAVAKSIEKKGSPAQPFLFPAMENQSGNVVNILGQAILNAFIKVFNK